MCCCFGLLRSTLQRYLQVKVLARQAKRAVCGMKNKSRGLECCDASHLPELELPNSRESTHQVDKRDVFHYHKLSSIYTHPSFPSQHCLRILRRSSASNNLHQLARNNSLSRPVIQNGELIDHVAGVLGSVVHGVAAGGLLAGVALGERPEEAVGERVFGHVGQHFVVDFEGGEIG